MTHPNDTLLTVGGRGFKCEACGSNVFQPETRRETETKYRCNGCGARYVGEHSPRQDLLEAGLADPAPVAGVSAEERARLREMAESPDPWTRYRVAPLLLAALDAAETRAAKWKERVGIGIKAYEERVEAAAALRRDLVAAEARAAQAEREHKEILEEARALAAQLSGVQSQITHALSIADRIRYAAAAMGEHR